jgi:hypothetical protein
MAHAEPGATVSDCGAIVVFLPVLQSSWSELVAKLLRSSGNGAYRPWRSEVSELVA